MCKKSKLLKALKENVFNQLAEVEYKNLSVFNIKTYEKLSEDERRELKFVYLQRLNEVYLTMCA